MICWRDNAYFALHAERKLCTTLTPHTVPLVFLQSLYSPFLCGCTVCKRCIDRLLTRMFIFHCLYVHTRSLVLTLHVSSGTVASYILTSLFRLTTVKVWCRTTCPDPAPENVTWCVNIAYLDRDVETCITTDATQEVITNSSCEAAAVGLPSYLSLPTVSSIPFAFPMPSPYTLCSIMCVVCFRIAAWLV